MNHLLFRYAGIMIMMLAGKIYWLPVKMTGDAPEIQRYDREKMNDGYKLVWSDEFNSDGAPDARNWRFEEGLVRNHEAQWYQPENAYCKNGYLIIEARREQKPNPNYVEGSNDWRKDRKNIDYTSACMITKDKQQWLYGRWEMRARIDVSAGLWPAWWALGVNKPWPSNGEIDMMEYYRGNLLANIATGTDAPHKAYWFSKKKPVDATWASKFHIWRMDWDAAGIALYVDDQLLNKVPMDSLANRDGTGFNPFKQPQFMLLNLAIGGDNGGDPAKTSFSRKFEVDYVRVYQQDDAGAQKTAAISKPETGSGYKLVWNDEFDHNGLPDDGKWGYDTGRTGWGNHELQNYTSKDLSTAKVSNGMLYLTANKQIEGEDTLYSSARLVTKNKGDWKYGKIEVRAKVARGLGINSAIWMLPTDWKYGRWPASGEIDIMEHIGWVKEKDSIFQTIHTGAYNHIKGTQRGVRTFVQDPPDDFHIYSAEWTPEGIDYFLDGKLRYHFPNEHNTSAEWPFDTKFHLIMNISVGGKWEGKYGIDPTIFPATMQIDYVRVYANL